MESVSVANADREVDVSSDLSPLAVLLSEAGLDFSASSVRESSANLEFNLEFTSGSVERLTVSGRYSEETKSLNLSWHFTFQREVSTDGHTELRTFEVNLQASISQVDRKSVTPYVQKEDILSLIRRLFRDIEKIAADENKVLGGVVLDYMDFREIFALNGGKLAHDLLALIELTVILARLRQKLDGDEEVVILAPKREVTRGINVTENSMRIESFHLEVRDVTSRLEAADHAHEESTLTTNGEGVSPEPVAATDAELVVDRQPAW